MLVWATEFPVAQNASVDEFWKILRVWLDGSPHSPLKSADLEAIPTSTSITEIDKQGHRVRMALVQNEVSELAGLQYEWIEDHQRQWLTEVVFRRSSSEIRCAVRVYCDLLSLGPRLPESKKPYVVKLLIRKLGSGRDGPFEVQDKAHRLEEADVHVASKLILGELNFRLPVVYLSATTAGSTSVDPDDLARWLSGSAHVLVEPSRHFSFALARSVQRRNPYMGAIGVFWPGLGGSHRRFLPTHYESRGELHQDLVVCVYDALTETRPSPDLTWSSINEGVARARLEDLRSRGSQDLSDYVIAFDQEQEALRTKLADAEREIRRLEVEKLRLESAANAGGGIISEGQEQELYPGEVKDTILAALADARSRLGEDSRRRHLVEDLLAYNEPTGTADEVAEALKNALSGMKKFGTSERRALENLGFVIEEGGKHAKARFFDDPRYEFTIAKTGSDHRGGTNMALQMIRTLLK